MSLPTINVSGYNGIINNLTVNGTLTNAGFAPSGNLNVTGNITATGTTTSTGTLIASNNSTVGGTLTVTGTTTCNGVLNSAGGFQQNGYTLGYLEAYTNTGQSIPNNTVTSLNFNTIRTNTFSSSVLTLTSNNTFTNTSGSTIYLNISANIVGDNGGSTINNITLFVNGANIYFNNANVPSGTLCKVSSCGTLSLASSGTFTVNTVAFNISNTGSISTGFNISNPNVITIKQIL